MSEVQETIAITVEFTGGLELLFSNRRKHHLHVPSTDRNGHNANITFLVQYLCEKLMKDPRRELFVIDDTVRPGILVLINDADWELEGGDRYELKKNDEILFVSTLHGG